MKKGLPMSLQIQAFCQVLILIISITITVVFYLDVKNVAENNFKEKTEVTMRYLNANLQGVLRTFTNMAENGAAIYNLLPSNAMALDVLERLGSTMPDDILDMYFGTVISRFAPGGFFLHASWDPPATWDQPNRPWHQAALANPDTTMIVDPYIDADTNELIITISRSVRNNQGEIIGVIGIDVLLTRLVEIVLAEKITDDGETMLIDSDGMYIVSRDFSKVTEVNIFNDIAGLNKAEILSGRSSIDIRDNYFYASAPLAGTDWFIVSSGSLDELKKETNRLLGTVIFIMLLLMAFSFFILLILTRRLTKPLKRVVNALEEISSDWNLTRRLDPKKTGGTTEIAVITNVFNLTFESLMQLVINIKNEAHELSEIGNALSIDMNDTAAAVNEITSNMDSIKTRIINQSASVSETHATMEQVVANIDKLNGHVENQSDNISQASASIEEMVANINSVTGTLVNNVTNVNNLIEASDIGRGGLQAVAQDIQEIARESEGLLEINSVMANIASQTNLLSMNAAIEAAHAGESGKGFAVVADEIRKLAENSSNQSKTIGVVLKKIKESIDVITKSTDKVLNNFEAIEKSVKIVSQQEENIRNAMEEQGQGSKQVLEGISNVNVITKNVKTGSNEMLEGAKEVIRESESLEKATQEITMGMDEMANGANHMNSAMHHIKEISAKNREWIKKLIGEVSRFKVE